MSSALSIVRARFPGVKRVIDAKRGLKITVEPRDASTGKKKDHESCAFARACQRKFKLDGVIISVVRAYLVKGDRAIRFDVPEAVSREIVAFDRGSDFAPGSYGLAKIAKSERIGNRAHRQGANNPHKAPSGKTRRAQYHRTEGIRGTLSVKG